MSRVFPKNTFKCFMICSSRSQDRLFAFAYSKYCCPNSEIVTFNRLYLSAPLDFRNPVKHRTSRLRPVGYPHAFLNPLALVECHTSSFYLLPTVSSVNQDARCVWSKIRETCEINDVPCKDAMGEGIVAAC